MFIGMNGASTMKADLVADINAASSAGFDVLEIWAEKLNPFLEKGRVDELKGLFEEGKIRPAAINSIEEITFRDDESYAGIRKRCRELATVASKIGCPMIVVVPSPVPPSRPEAAEVTAESARVLADLAGVAGEQGVRLAFEFIGLPDFTVNSLGHAIDIIEKVDLENVGYVLDAFHFFTGPSTMEELGRVKPEKLFLFHINDAEPRPAIGWTDANRLLPGEGIMPLREILESLKGALQDGITSVELFNPSYWERDPKEFATDAMAKTRALLEGAGVAGPESKGS